METFAYDGYAIPVQLMRLTGGGPETFDAIAQSHLRKLQEYVGIGAEDHVVEIGCGIGRDAIPLTKVLGPNARYLGVDIVKDSIDWCKANIGARFPNFRFVHFDVKDQLHNPGGTISTQDIRLSVADHCVDLVILQSVFTHMFAEDILHYLREFGRILKRGGKVYATLFLVNDAILSSARATNRTPFDLRFEHALGDGCFINDPVHPLGAVAYTHEAFRALVEQAGLCLQRCLKGKWSGYYAEPEVGQDVALIASRGG